MPRLSSLSIRLALLYLLAGFTFGALLLAHKGMPYWQGVWYLLPAHIEFLIMGWTVNLIIGVAFWILPRHVGGSRGRVELAWLALVLLNLGLWLVVLGGFSARGELLLFAGRLSQALAVASYAFHAWERVRPTVVPSPKS